MDAENSTKLMSKEDALTAMHMHMQILPWVTVLVEKFIYYYFFHYKQDLVNFITTTALTDMCCVGCMSVLFVCICIFGFSVSNFVRLLLPSSNDFSSTPCPQRYQCAPGGSSDVRALICFCIIGHSSVLPSPNKLQDDTRTPQ